MWSDKTTPTLRKVEGRICTVCRRVFPGAMASAKLERCPEHTVALVDVAAFVASGEDPLLGSTVAGRFTVLAKLGAGSMGAVYRARQEGVGRDVALKILLGERAYDASAKARFEREARTNSVLQSPYTVTVFDFGVAEGGALFLAMELLEGESLGQRLRREGRLGVRDAVRFAREALSSLAEAHDKGIVHRDIKPDNLFLARVPGHEGGASTEVCKVLDFGIAKVVRDEGGVDALQTQAGTVFGTPRYMSPEQAQGKPLDARSDLYSMGVIVYQTLTGRAPFEDEDAVLVMAQHIKAKPPAMHDVAPDVRVPAEIERVVAMALSKDPSSRPASADEFVRMLESALAAGGVEATVARGVVHVDSSSASRSRPSRGAMAAGTIALVVGFAVATWRLSGGGPTEATAVASPSVDATGSASSASAVGLASGQSTPSGAAPEAPKAGAGAASASAALVAAPDSDVEFEMLPAAPSSSATERSKGPARPERDRPRPAARPATTVEAAPPAATKAAPKYGRFE